MQTYVHSILNKLIRPECRREENTLANVSMQCDAIPSTLMLAADSRHNGVTHANEIYFFSFIFTAILIYLFLCLVLCLLFLHRIFFSFVTSLGRRRQQSDAHHIGTVCWFHFLFQVTYAYICVCAPIHLTISEMQHDCQLMLQKSFMNWKWNGNVIQ